MSEEMFPNPNHLTTPPTVSVVRAIGSKVESAGGQLLPEPCRPDDVILEIGGVKRAGETCSCGNTTRMALPAPSVLEGATGEILVTVCAICDSVVDMPRFGATR